MRHTFTLWNVQQQRAVSVRVRAFERSVKEGVSYDAFRRHWPHRLSLAWGWWLANNGLARWSKRSGRFILEGPNPLGEADTWRKSKSRLLLGKSAPPSIEREAIALIFSDSLEGRERLKGFPIEGQAHKQAQNTIEARLAFALGRVPLPRPEMVQCEAKFTPTNTEERAKCAVTKSDDPPNTSKAPRNGSSRGCEPRQKGSGSASLQPSLFPS